MDFQKGEGDQDMKPKPLNFDFERGLKRELQDIEKDLRTFREDEKFFGKEGVDYYYKQELVDRRKEVLATIELIGEIKQRIKSACEFYLKYKDKPELLLKEYPEYSEKEIPILDSFDEPEDKVTFEEYIRILLKLDINDFGEYCRQVENGYNDWLFKLTFKDVFEK